MQRKHLWLKKLLECKNSVLESNLGLYLHRTARCLYSFPYTCSQSVLETGQWVFYLQQYRRFLSSCFYSVAWNHKNCVAPKMFLSSNTPGFWSYSGCRTQRKINQFIDMVIYMTKAAYETKKNGVCWNRKVLQLGTPQVTLETVTFWK